MSRITDWLNSAEGQAFNPDGAYGLQCLTLDAEVLMAEGSKKPVGDLVPGDKVRSTHGGINTVISNQRAVLPVYEIKTAQATLRASTEHLFEVWHNDERVFKEAKYIKEGEHISTVKIDDKGNLCTASLPVLYKSEDTTPAGVSVLELDGDKTYIAEGHGHHNCKDLADAYCVYLFGDWQNTLRPNDAADAFNGANDEYFIKIANNPNDPNLIPQPGDIITWGPMPGNSAGHIAVVYSADANGVTVLEQDGFLQIPARKKYWPNYIVGGVLTQGWLRPRPEKIIGYAQPVPPKERKAAVTVNARDEPNTTSGIFQQITAGDTVEMKGWVQGEPVDGNTTWFVTARSGKYMSAEAFEDKGTHDLPDLTPKANPTERTATSQGVRARKAPNTSSEVAQTVEGGKTVEMKGWTRGEAVEPGNDIWFVSKNNGLYLYSGAFTDSSVHDLPEIKQDTLTTESVDYSKIILDVSNNQPDEVSAHFHKFGGVILKAGHVGQNYGGDANKIDPKLVKFAEAAGDKLLGIYWLPYFSTDEEARAEAERFAEAQKLVNAPLLFVDLEPEFEGTPEQLKMFDNIVLQKTGKTVFVYGGDAVISKLGLERVDWYPNYGTKDNYAHGSLIHQYTETGKVDGYGGNLDFSTSKLTIEELKKIASVTSPEAPGDAKDERAGTTEEKTKENKMVKPTLSLEDSTKLAELAQQQITKTEELAESDIAKELTAGISKRTKLIIYIVGDTLLGASAIAPQAAVAILSDDAYVKINAISGILATAGLFLLTMFGIYKSGRKGNK